MLPSTGYFKGISCPFYDSGLCERPYCHFRHVKKELQSSTNDGIESGTLQKLVSAAVQKVLQQTEASCTAISIAETLSNTTSVTNQTDSNSLTKVTYSPTPISELRKLATVDGENTEESPEQLKRHIPVPYTPRKPSGLLMKRPVEEEITPFIYNPPPLKYKPGSTEALPLDPYTPKGSIELTEKYLPGTEALLPEYSPCETQSSSVKHNYSPSGKSNNAPSKHKLKLLEYRPKKVNTANVPSVTYQPTPRSLAPCFSSDEDEPEPKKLKIPSDMNGLDDLGPEFDILGQILDEENPNDIVSEIVKSKISKNVQLNANECKENGKTNEDNIDKNKSIDKKSSEKIKSSGDSKHKNSKSKSSEKKTSHKSSSRDRDKSSEKKKDRDKHAKSERKKDEKKDIDKKKDSNKDSSIKKDTKIKHSSSKDADSKSRHSKSSSSKESDRYSKKSSKSKSNSKHNNTKDRKDNSKTSKPNEQKSKNEGLSLNHHSDSDAIDADLTIDETQEEIEISEDEESIAMECKKIFEEYVPTEVPKNNEQLNNTKDTPDDEYIPCKQRISRTADKKIKIIPKAPIKPDFKVSASQAMAERLAKVREYHASKTAQNVTISENLPPKNTFATPNAGNSKIRIAHVPYASTLMYAKKTIAPSTAKSTEPSTSTTITQTVKKGAQRVAHMPNDKFIDRPGVLEPLASKIPANIRSTYLNMMIDECIKIYLTAPDAYSRAQHEELATSKKCKTVQIYKNSAVLAVSRLRKELQECKGVKKSASDCVTLQKLPQTISGQSGNTGSWSIENKNRRNSVNVNEFSGSKFYNNITKWVLTEDQLKENGFPRPHPNGSKGRAIIYGQNKKRPPVGFIRTCCRCKKDYTVDKKGFALVKEECLYHPNNKYRVRGEARYQCCSQDATSDGCCVAPSHVYEYVDFENLKGYVTTLPPDFVMDDYGVYSLDCEMCYTTQGLDLTRITVINSSCKVVYETLIKPLHPIIDYNTRYSGITEEHMADVKTTLLEVQATLLAMFNSKTILIGHSLESDFKALKLVHNTVVDTSVLFPHKMGPPYKRALRNLSSEHLKKIIQNSVDGHDSAEDATVCMELIHYKLKEDLKTR